MGTCHHRPVDLERLYNELREITENLSDKNQRRIVVIQTLLIDELYKRAWWLQGGTKLYESHEELYSYSNMSKPKQRGLKMIYFNGLAGGVLFGLGIFIAEVLVRALFHQNIC